MRIFLNFVVVFSLCLAPQVLANTVLFDQGHGQRFHIQNQGPLDLSKLSDTFESQGYQVISTTSELTGERLQGIDVLFISGAFNDFSSTELQVIDNFIRAGGKLCITLHVGPLSGMLLSHLGVSVTNAVVKEESNLIEDNPLNFRVSHLGTHPLFNNVDSMSFYGSWALKGLTSDAELLSTSSHAWLDFNRNNLRESDEPIGKWSVALAGHRGKGMFVIFGDDAIFQNQYLKDTNQVVAENLAKWLR